MFGTRQARGGFSSADFSLLWRLVRRDFEARFAGSALGMGWAFAQPVLQIILYWVVFGVMLSGGRFGTGGDGYALFLIAGLLPWFGFQEGLMRSASSILDGGVILKRIPMKSQILVAVPGVTALSLEIVGLAVYIAFLVFTGEPITWMILILPVALVAQLAMQIGLGLVLAPIVAVFRDILQVLGFVLTAFFFLSPILYDARPGWELIFGWNPLTPLIGLFRSALLGAPLPSLFSLVYMVGMVIVVFWVGLRLCDRLGPSIADLV